jgi:hypothetical protein
MICWKKQTVQNSKAVNWLLMKQNHVSSRRASMFSEVISRCCYLSGLGRATNNNVKPESVA